MLDTRRARRRLARTLGLAVTGIDGGGGSAHTRSIRALLGNPAVVFPLLHAATGGGQVEAAVALLYAASDRLTLRVMAWAEDSLQTNWELVRPKKTSFASPTVRSGLNGRTEPSRSAIVQETSSRR